MSFYQLFADQPQPEIARSAVVLGDVHVGAGAILAQGLVVRAHGAAVSIGNHSAILENGVVIGTPEHPVQVGCEPFSVGALRSSALPSATCARSATARSSCRLPSRRRLHPGQGTLVPPDTVIPADSVLVGRPPHVIRSATDTDRERLAALRQHQTNLTDYPGTIVHGPFRRRTHGDCTRPVTTPVHRRGSAVRLGGDHRRRSHRRKLAHRAGVKIIGDSHGPVRIGSRVQILENTVLHLLPDNELIIDDAVVGPGAMIHGCHIGRGSVVEPARSCATAAWSGPSRWSAPVPASSSATVSATGPSWTASRPNWSAPSPDRRRCRAGPCPPMPSPPCAGCNGDATAKKGEQCLSR